MKTNTHKDEEYKGKYCPIRQSNIQPLRCIEEYCMFFRKGYSTTNGRGRKDSCWILDGFVGLALTWEIKE